MTKKIIIKNSHFSVYADEVFKLKNLVQMVANLMNFDLVTEAGFYPYREREIMIFKPTFSNLPNWKSKVSMKEGLNFLLTKR